MNQLLDHRRPRPSMVGTTRTPARQRVIGPVLIVSALAVLALPARASATPAHGSKLTVTGLTFKSSPSQSASARYPSVVLESDRHGRFGIVFKINNLGKRRSHNTHAQV